MPTAMILRPMKQGNRYSTWVRKQTAEASSVEQHRRHRWHIGASAESNKLPVDDCKLSDTNHASPSWESWAVRCLPTCGCSSVVRWLSFRKGVLLKCTGCFLGSPNCLAEASTSSSYYYIYLTILTVSILRDMDSLSLLLVLTAPDTSSASPQVSKSLDLG